ncbi:MAG: hypothetical protein ACI8UO_004295 [Verrucomicrobiales bacterium]|jgi:hypothetical protein
MRNYRNLLSFILSSCWLISPAFAQEDVREIHVFVALCDNESQGIAPVNERIGNGDDPAANLYWGCSDGLRSFFKNSSRWKLTDTAEEPAEGVLERLTFEHSSVANVRLIAHAYRGSEIKKCMTDFFEATTSETSSADLVAFIGHNGLMDFRLESPEKRESGPARDAIVLACKSGAYFRERLRAVGVRPILLTDQFMYPGSFLLHDAIEGWLEGESLALIRDRAAKAYAKNQSISVKSARGVFSDLSESDR